MACNCGKGRLSGGSGQKWVHTTTDGAKKTYSSETEARMAASRQGGSVKRA